MVDRATIKGFVFGDASDDLSNHRQQYIEFYHLPSNRSVQFKAFLTQFSDQYASDWNEEDVFGRMDPISVFKRTKRIISLAWNVPSASIEESILNLERVSVLLTMLYPEYEELDGGASRIKSGPLFKLRFMNLIQNVASPGLTAKSGGLLGKVSGFTYEPDLEQGFYDSMDPAEEASFVKFALPENDSGELIFPQTIKLACEYTVLHEHPLGWHNKDPREDFDKFPYSAPRVNFEGSDRIDNALMAPITTKGLTVEDRKELEIALRILKQ